MVKVVVLEEGEEEVVGIDKTLKEGERCSRRGRELQ